MQKTKEDLELTLDDGESVIRRFSLPLLRYFIAIGMSDPSFIALSLSAKDGILEG